ncbi:MAG: hypothetical protein ACE5JI_21430, partial [Acidobacteriota bacterium]
ARRAGLFFWAWQMPKHGTKTRQKLEAAFHEVKHDEPSIVGHTRRKFGKARAEAQKTAIALDKAREAGARIRRKPKGSGAFSEAELAQGFKRLT